jgi:hypothetical protein
MSLVHGKRLSVRLAILSACMIAGALLPPIAFRLIAGPAPDWSCGQSAPRSAGSYLFWQEGVYLISATVLVVALFQLSRERRGATWTTGSAPAGTATIVALMSVAALTAIFMALHDAFAVYGSILVLVAVSIFQLGFLGGLAGLALVSVVLIRTGRPDANTSIRTLQVLGWSALAVGLPVAFIFTAPLGPILC